MLYHWHYDTSGCWIRAETPLKDRYTLIERSITLIEQSDHLAAESRMSIIMGIIG